MPKPVEFRTPTLTVTSFLEDGVRWFVAWRPGTSQMFTDAKELLRWVKWPAKTPTGDALRDWLAQLPPAGPPEGPHGP